VVVVGTVADEPVVLGTNSAASGFNLLA